MDLLTMFNQVGVRGLNKILPGLLVSFFVGCTFLILLTAYRNVPPAKGYAGSDINHIWNDGHQISQGLNPYSIVSQEDYNKKRKKHSTYLPGFYVISAVGVFLGLDTFEAFIRVWRPLNLMLVFFTGGLAFLMVWQSNRNYWLAGFGACFWYFNRWTLGLVQQCQIDILAILLLLCSLFFLKKRTEFLGYILFGLSLSVKQIGIFLAPLYLIWALHKSGPKGAFVAILTIACIPILISLPFLCDDLSGFVNSILFSAERSSRSYMHAQGLDAALLLTGFAAKIPMLAMLFFVYFLAFRKFVAPFVAALMVMLVFIGFNSVLFKQYFVWPIALGVLCLGYILPEGKLCAPKDNQ